MVRHIEDEIEYYYDSHSTEEDLMGETAFHVALVRYLVAVLTWLFDGQPCAIHENLNIYQTSDTNEYPIVPDIAVVKGLPYQWVRSWKVGKTGAAPHVVFEIASDETWAKDLREKPAKYAQLGVQEYFAYDPNDPPLPRSRSRRLFGWRLDLQQGIMRPMSHGERGEMWSAQLESWLVPDGVFLRLYDRAWQMRLTQAEAAEWHAAIEARKAEEAIRQAEILKEKLRSLGIDPDQLI